jgi:hypothetical protein
MAPNDPPANVSTDGPGNTMTGKMLFLVSFTIFRLGTEILRKLQGKLKEQLSQVADRNKFKNVTKSKPKPSAKTGLAMPPEKKPKTEKGVFAVQDLI